MQDHCWRSLSLGESKIALPWRRLIVGVLVWVLFFGVMRSPAVALDYVRESPHWGRFLW